MSQKNTDISQEAPVDRAALLRDLGMITRLPPDSASPALAGLQEIAKDALRLLEEYDSVLRNLALSLSAGGYNSDGLIEPQVADDKIRWGIDYLLATERQRAAAEAVADRAMSGTLRAVGAKGEAAPPMPFRILADMIAQHYEGCADDKLISIGAWQNVGHAPTAEFRAYLSVPLADWRAYARQGASDSIAPSTSTGSKP